MKRTDLQSNRQFLAQHRRSIKHNLYEMKSRRSLLSLSPKTHPQSHGTPDSWRKKKTLDADEEQTSVPQEQAQIEAASQVTMYTFVPEQS